MKKIFLTGGTGLLGKELLKINTDIIAPRRHLFDITNKHDISHLFWVNPDILIHCAAMLDDVILKDQPWRAIEANIIGTANLAVECSKLGIRMIFISTDYVYPGVEGNYKETDDLNPYNFYSYTKLGGECAVKGVKDHLIIRTTFGPPKFPYKQAFSDAYRSKDYVDVIAPMIYEAAISDLQGVINIGTERKSMYEYAKQRNPDVLPVKVEDSGFDAPLDTSFNLNKWKNYKNGK